MNKITVCVLVYGDHPELARRCLSSILDGADYDVIADVRVGLNAVSPAVAAYVHRAGFRARGEGCRDFYTFTPSHNVGKYPLMRRMLYSGRVRKPDDLVMWFDDDSFLDGGSLADLTWWKKVRDRMDLHDVIGSIYGLTPPRYRPGQKEGIKAQPWYAGKPLDPTPPFATGGWWVARWGLLKQWDYPFKALHHNGGDSILGELCRQQGLRLGQFKEGVAINWDGGESRAERRGISSPWPWEGYRPGQEVDDSHHLFDCAVSQVHSMRGTNPEVEIPL